MSDERDFLLPRSAQSLLGIPSKKEAAQRPPKRTTKTGQKLKLFPEGEEVEVG
jgi:hypothetical protein